MAEAADAEVVKSTIRSVFGTATPHQFSILAGAGASVDSGLPRASELSRFLMLEAGLASGTCERVLTQKIPLERVLQTLLLEISDPSLFDLFKLGRPNLIHSTVAQLYMEGAIHSIFTTNFDELFERALSRPPATRPFTRVVLGVDDGPQPEGSSERGVVAKLHGSVSVPESIRGTLAAVGNAEVLADLPSPLEYLFVNGPHDFVVSFGYCWSDAFDINPILSGLRARQKPVFVLKHLPFHSNQVQVVKVRKDEGRALPVSCTVLEGRIPRLLALLGRACGAAPRYRKPPFAPPPNWKSFVRRWYRQVGPLSEPTLGLIRGKILMEAGFGSEAYAEHLKAVNAAERLDSNSLTGADRQLLPRLRGMTCWAAYGSSEGIGNPHERLEWAEKAHGFLKDDPPSFELVNVLVALGTGLASLGRKEEAQPMLERALRLNDELLPSRRNISLYHLVGKAELSVGRTMEAKQVLEAGLRLSRARGYLAMSAAFLHLLSQVESAIGNIERSKDLQAESLSLAERLGDPRLMKLVQQKGILIVG